MSLREKCSVRLSRAVFDELKSDWRSAPAVPAPLATRIARSREAAVQRGNVPSAGGGRCRGHRGIGKPPVLLLHRIGEAPFPAPARGPGGSGGNDGCLGPAAGTDPGG